jgi:hypothetical protein
MNERILKLLAQTDIPQFPILGSLAWVATDHDMEKFAELIVRECADTVTDRCEMRNESDVKRAEYHAKRIKEHFGVER